MPRNTVEILLSAKDQASKAIHSAFGSIQTSSKVALRAVATGAAVAGTALATISGLVTKTGISYNAMAESSQVAWNTLLGSQEKAKKMIQEIANFAKSTQFDTTTVDAMAKYMNNAGYAGEQLFDQLTKIADVAGAFNIPADSAQELARQMSQVQQAGVAYTEDLNILGDRGVPILQALADVMGTNVAGVKKMASEGKITADVYNQAFDQIANKVKGSSEAQSQTFTGMVSTIQDQLSMLAGALAKPLFEKLKVGMDKLMPALDALVSYASGDMKSFSETMDKTFGAGAGEKMIGFANGLKSTVDGIKSGLSTVKSTIQAAFDFGKGNNIGGITILTKMGLSPETITKVVQVVNTIKGHLTSFFTTIKSLFAGSGGLGESWGKIFTTAKSIIMPIVSEIVSFVKSRFGMIKQFWDENGAMIIQAIKNVWAIITAIFKAVAPVILFILKMLWDTVAGIIDGALKIIMGLVKIFAGLFTGNFGKMWEGIKQLFVGALQFLWNLVNLLLVGKLIGSIKAFVVKGIEAFAGFGTKAIGFFKNLDTTLFNVAKNMISKVLGFFKNLYTQGAQIFGTLRTFGANAFSSMWSAIRGVTSNIVSGVKGYFSNMVTGAKFQMQGLLNTAKSIFNGIKNAITNPIETAKSLVGKAISGIKSAFSNMKVKIPLPHFNFGLGKKDIGGVSVPYPKMSVDWYDKGGVFYGPQVIGVGEKRPEFVGALDDLKTVVQSAIGDTIASSVGNAVVQAMQFSRPANSGDLVLKLDGRTFARIMKPYMDQENKRVGTDVRLQSI